ncbi:MAG TPA: SPOR domain-containing protein [Chryseolinea sp.]
MRSHHIFIYFIVVVWLAGCASPKSTTVSSQGQAYSEDLSIWRPKAETPANNNTTTNVPDNPKQTPYVEPKYAVNKKLDTVLDSIDRYNRSKQFVDGFTIQIYAGLKREDALNAKKNLASSLPDLSSEVEYAQPNFRVKVGKYYTRIDAQRDYVAVKKYFPTAIVIPDKVSIN